MKKHLLLILSVFCCAAFLSAQNTSLKKAEESFNKRLYQQAVTEYAPFLKSKNKQEKYEAQSKTILAYNNLYQYDNALKTIYSFDMPKEEPYKTRFYLLKAQLLDRTLYNYQSPDLIESQDDPTKWTTPQKEKEVKDIYQKLWDNRKDLVLIEAEQEKPYITLERYSLNQEFTPSVYDTLVNTWINQNIVKQDKAYEESYKLEGKNREPLREHYRLLRIMMFKNQDNQEKLQKCLDYIAGYGNTCNLAEVKPYLFKAQYPFAKAEALYESASILNNQEKNFEAVKRLDVCLNLPANYWARNCNSLKESIKSPRFSLTEGFPKDMAPNQERKMKYTAANENSISVKIYKLNAKEVYDKGTYYYSSYKYTPDEKSLYKTFTINPEYTEQYQVLKSDFILPALESGFYFITLKPASSSYAITYVVNATDLAFIQTSYNTTNNLYKMDNKTPYAHFYTLNAKTGLPLEKSKIITNLSVLNFDTDKQGQAKVKIAPNLYNKKALAQNKNNYALLENLSTIYTEEKSYIPAMNTDSAIYKPGDEVKIQVMAVIEENSLWKPYANKKVTLKLHAPNWREIAKEEIIFDDFGTANVTFTLPKDAMLGNWTINAEGDIYASAGFSVEEYKQPEFEISLENYKGTPAFDKPLTINGTAAYFRGDKVAKAKVSYIITKSYFRPWFCWWMPIRNDRSTALEGTTTTDEQGKFSITWTPKEEKTNSDNKFSLPAHYEVKVFITDQAGNTIQGSKSYLVSRQKYFFAMKREEGFFTTEGENSFSVKMVNADEEPLAGKAQAQIIKLDLKDTQPNFSLDGQNLFTEGKTISTFEVSFNTKEPAQVKLPKLEEGIYQLKFTNNKDEGKLNFLVVNTKNTKLALPSLAIAQYNKYAPGEKALVLLGNLNTRSKYVELLKKNFLIEQKTLNKNGVVVLEIPIKSSYSGGITLRWFGVANYQNYTSELNIPVIYPNTKITAQINGKDTMEPGKEVSLSLDAKDEKNTPLEAKAVISVYDKALDYYRKHNLNLPSVYPDSVFRSALFTANFEPGYHFANPIYRSSGLLTRSVKKSLASASLAGSADLEDGAVMMSAKQSIAKNSTWSATDSKEMATEESATNMAAFGAQEQEEQANLRQDFASTAYWNPALDIKQGKGSFNFKLPDSLTKWQVLAALWTKDLKTGKTDFTFTATKDLILTLQTPRFLREGDKIELRTMLVNNSNKTLPTKVSLNITLDGQNAQELFKLNKTEQQITLSPNEQKVISWPLEAPTGTGIITINAAARSGSFVDGEERVLPLLTARQRLVENDTIALKEGINKLSLENLMKDDTLELETVQLHIDPSLIMPVLNTMPLLIDQTDSTLTSKLINYYPLAVLNKMYQTYPEFKQAAANLPKRDTILPAWQKDENLLLNKMENSPWYNLSKGYKSDYPTIDIFNAKLVAKKQKELNKELPEYQNSDGSFNWIKGEREGSLYMTLYYLEQAAMARLWDIEINENMTKKALSYAISKIRIDLERPNFYDLNQAFYLADILTSFPSNWYNYDVKSLMEKTYQYVDKMTPYGKAKAALVWIRLGDKAKAEHLIENLMDSAKTSKITGIYWAPEEKSWQWFNDSVTLHSAVIKALLALNPQDPRIKELTKWLLFQKGATLWGNREQAATAVFTIFEIMKQTKALEQTKTFDITWNKQDIKLEAKPFDIDESKFNLAAYGKEATPQSLSAIVVKSKDSGLDDFASLTALYSSKNVQEQSKKGLMNIKKEYYLVKDKNVILLKQGDEVEVGSEIQVRLTINCQNPFDFVSVSDFKPAAFENQDLLSSWQYKNRLSYYQEMQNSQTNFYFNYLPNGTYELKYTIRPTTPGFYNAGAAVIQSQFAPQFGAHSAGFYIKVK